jgi:hypothetical protein
VRKHKLGKEVVKRRLRIVRHAAMHRRGLDDCAARRAQPVKALTSRQFGDRAALVVTGNDLKQSLQVTLDGIQVELGRERAEARGIEDRACAEEGSRRAKQHDADVDAFTALNARHDTD